MIILLNFGLWMLELLIFDLKIRFSVKFPPRGLILRSQFWILGPKTQKIKDGRKASAVDTDVEVEHTKCLRLDIENYVYSLIPRSVGPNPGQNA